MSQVRILPNAHSENNMNILVGPESDGKSLINFLKSKHIPFALLQKFLRKGKIIIDEQIIKSNVNIYTNQKIEIRNFDLENTKENPKNKQKNKLDLSNIIIYSDNNIIAINKPSGLAVQGGCYINVSVDDYAKNNNFNLVHRLDKDTSGVLLLAKNIDATRKLEKAFKKGLIKKIYYAITVGSLLNSSGEIRIKIGSKLISGQEKILPSENGKDSVTQYKVLKTLINNQYLLELRPLTGRKHQLRAHCSYMHSPILGDKKYAEKQFREKEMYLHAKQLTIANEVFGKEIKIEAELPQYFKEKLI